MVFVAGAMACTSSVVRAQDVAQDACPRPAPGSAVAEPEDLRSVNGVLQVDLTVRNSKEKDGSTRYCYVLADGKQSPTLRVSPGDLLILRLKNELSAAESAGAAIASAQQSQQAQQTQKAHVHGNADKKSDPCNSSTMTITSTNLHFHGLTIPPVCHQDDVLKTSIQPGDPAV